MYGNSTIPGPPTDTAQSTTIDTKDRYYLLTCHFYRKTARFKVFQYKISNRMSYERAFKDNFENLKKLKILMMKCHYLNIFQIIVECSLIAHLIGNDILKNFKTGPLAIKMISTEL